MNIVNIERRIELEKIDINGDEYYSFYLRNLNGFEYIYLNFVFYILNCNDYSDFEVKGKI